MTISRKAATAHRHLETEAADGSTVSLSGAATPHRYVGTDANETLRGSNGADTLIGSGGNDTLYGGDGVDYLYGDGTPGKPAGVGHGTGRLTVAPGAGNDSMPHAIDVSNAFALFRDNDIQDSSVLPHVSITATGEGHLDYYSIFVNAGTSVTLDIDHTQNIDTNLNIYDSDGNFITHNDDAEIPDFDGGSDTATDSMRDFYIYKTGRYYVEVGNTITANVNGLVTVGPVPGDATYTLQVTVVDTPGVGDGHGNDLLNGGSGADYMIGGAGNDLYVVDNAGDQVIEKAGEGRDRVLATVDYTLGAGQSIEVLSTRSSLDTAPINLTGNELANSIWGDAGNNRLDGGGGADALYGRGGDDTYYVDNFRDQVFEAANGGNDTVVASYSYTLPTGQEIESLVSASTTDYTYLTGNEFDNVLRGSRGYSVLDGGAGADTMYSGGGNSNTSDVFYVDNAGDRVFDTSTTGGDVRTSISYAIQDSQNIATLETTDVQSTKAINLTGNNRSTNLYGNAGNNILNGGGGKDGFQGNGGADTFVLSAPSLSNTAYIYDFANSTTDVHDTVFLSRSLFAALAPGDTVTADEFSVNTVGADTRLLYKPGSYYNYGNLYYDPDGSGSAPSVLIAEFQHSPALSVADFTVG